MHNIFRHTDMYIYIYIKYIYISNHINIHSLGLARLPRRCTSGGGLSTWQAPQDARGCLKVRRFFVGDKPKTC